ncbi:hypothetical protein PCASD_24279, partial [Puccinia coronata f. sp. avenae]
MAHHQSSYSNSQIQLAPLMGNMNTHQPSTGNNNLELHQGYPQNQYPAGNLNTNDPRSHQIPDGYNHPYQNQPRTKNQTQYPS